LKVLRGDLMGNDMKSLHAKFCEFTIHIKGDMNLSLFLFSEFCTLGKQELRIFDYMKDVVQMRWYQQNLIHICLIFVLSSMNFEN
jgi:hypothetical protein